MKRRVIIAAALAVSCAALAFAAGTDENGAADDSGTITLRIMRQFVGGMDPATEPGVQVINEVTGYETVWELLPAESPMDKLNLLLAAGDEYDFIYISNSNSAVVADYATRGVLTDLTDKLGDYPNLAKIPDNAWSRYTFDGRTFAVPSTGLPIPQSINFVRQDWLDALGAGEPSTRQELYDLLVAFRDEDPGNNGDRNVPFGMVGPWHPGLASTFGILYPQQLSEGRIYDTRLTEEYRDYLSFLNRLYEEDLLDPDFPVMTSVVFREKVAAGGIGAFSGWVDDAVSLHTAAESEGDMTSRYTALETLDGPDGVKRNFSQAGPHNVGFVPTSSSKADDVLGWLNVFMDDANWKEITIGIEGIDHEVQPDGRTFPILPRFDEIRSRMWALLPVQNGEQYFPLWLTRIRKNPIYFGVYDQMLPQVDPYKVANELAYLPIGENRAQNGRLIEDYIEEESIKFIAGARPISEFSEFVSEVEDLGMNEVISEMQIAWDNR